MQLEGEDAPNEQRRRPPTVDDLVLARARRGDQEAFETVYRAFAPFLQRHLRLTCGDRADDVGAATWESVAGSIGRFRGDADAFRRWLFTIARRRLVDDLRRDGRRPSPAVDEDAIELVVDFASPLETNSWIASALSGLPARQAEVISLRIVGGLPVVEVAELLGISEENVRVLSHRGLTALRAAFDRAGDGDPAPDDVAPGPDEGDRGRR